jgi:hypothetical protein
MLSAKDRRWNGKTRSWEVFEDYETQIKAVQEIAKIFGSYPTQKELEDRRPKASEVTVRVVYEEPIVRQTQAAKPTDSPPPEAPATSG